MAKITKEVAERLLGVVPADKDFYCCDGGRIQSMPELENALKEMDDESFSYHSNESKNDFSTWVREVIGDEKLSRDLQKSRSCAAALKAVAARVDSLKMRL